MDLERNCQTKDISATATKNAEKKINLTALGFVLVMFFFFKDTHHTIHHHNSYPGRESLLARGKRQRSDWMIVDAGSVQLEERQGNSQG